MPSTSEAFQEAPYFNFLNSILFHVFEILQKIAQSTSETEFKSTNIQSTKTELNEDSLHPSLGVEKSSTELNAPLA